MLVYTVKFYDATETQLIATQHVVALSPEEAIKQAEKDNPQLTSRKAIAKAQLFEIPGYILEARPEGQSKLYFIMDYEQVAEIHNEANLTNNQKLKDKMSQLRDKLDKRVEKDHQQQQETRTDKEASKVDSKVEPKYRVLSRPSFDD